MGNIILGLDCATKTGWCVYDARTKKIIGSGVQDFSKKRGESNGLMFLRFSKWLRELISLTQPFLIAYERAHFRGGAATEICVGLQTRAQEYAVEIGIEAAPVTSGNLKKFVTGGGKANKEQMTELAKNVLGRDPIDDNEADAIHIARWAAETYL